MTDIETVRRQFVDSYYQLYGLKEVKTRKEFAERIKIKASNFKEIENGKRMPTIDQLCNLINEFNISIEWIFLGEGSMKKPLL